MIKTVVLAAGKGTRLKSKTPKVLHRVFDKPVLYWVLDALAEIPQDEIIVVSGYKSDDVEAFLHAYPVTMAKQESQLGTGDALKSAAAAIGDDFEGTVLVINGDCPLIKAETINSLLDQHKKSRAEVTLLTCSVWNPGSMGRIVRRNDNIIAIQEAKDCSEAESAINEVNAGVYAFDWLAIKDGLKALRSNNAQEEYYLTDLVAWAYSQGYKISNFKTEDELEILGVNNRNDLAKVAAIKNKNTIEELQANGVTIIDPSNTYISPDVDIDADTVIYPGTYIQRRVVIGKGCEIGPNTSIFGPAEIGSGSTVIQSHIFRSSIGENCSVGPFAHIRDGSDITDNVRIGNFVEVKNCEIGDGTAAAHLSYLGDSQIKSNVNIGAGTITANYNSRTGEKNQTVIKKGASTGSNSVLVAPVEIGEGSMVAAGTVVTNDVPDHSLAIARPKQEIKELKKKAAAK